MMITQHDNNGELSCFKSALLFYLRESHPHMADDKAFIRERADSAAEAYEHAIRDGYPSGRLWNRLTPFSIRTCAFPGSIRFSRPYRSGFPKYGPKDGRISA